jgi:hypothetical protein
MRQPSSWGVTMHAIRLHAFGPAENLVHEQAEDPVPGPGQVRIAVASAGVHLLDAALRAGHRGPLPERPALPTVPGREVAGSWTRSATESTGCGSAGGSWPTSASPPKAAPNSPSRTSTACTTSPERWCWSHEAPAERRTRRRHGSSGRPERTRGCTSSRFVVFWPDEYRPNGRGRHPWHGPGGDGPAPVVGSGRHRPRPAHGRPGRDDREHRAPLRPARPAHVRRQPAVGDHRLHPRLRRAAPAGRTDRRPGGPQAHLRHRAHRLRRRLRARRRRHQLRHALRRPACCCSPG